MSNPFLTKEELMVDQRLNPVMLGRRRISEGSLADEADYSRKILRVANPDDD
jgi:cell wall integrity and stress response component